MVVDEHVFWTTNELDTFFDDGEVRLV